MSEPFVGQIMLFGGNFAPRGWAFCDGQLLAINQNDALFSLLGTLYGGDGRTTFALPDLRGRTPVHMGEGPGLSERRIGSDMGEEEITLNINQMANHQHILQATTNEANSNNPTNMQLAKTVLNIYSDATPEVDLNTSAIGMTGGNQPHENMMPFQCINFCIALFGIYPSRQ